MKKYIVLALGFLIVFASCKKDERGGEITVISREDGSGTRGAFVELFNVLEKGSDGKVIDNTTPAADVTNSTSVVITSVSQNKRAIGYISLGSMSDTVKALDIDGTAARAENVKNGSYKIFRPFNIVVKSGMLSPAAEDFISYILSPEGQEIVRKAGYVAVTDTSAYSGAKAAGRVVVAGSSSVTPVMEKLKEAFAGANPNIEVEIQQSDSTMGINNTIDGICEIGMASRSLKDSESAGGLETIVIAFDGIAVIVHNENPLQGLTKEQVRDIYTGKISRWDDLFSDSL